MFYKHFIACYLSNNYFHVYLTTKSPTIHQFTNKYTFTNVSNGYYKV